MNNLKNFKKLDRKELSKINGGGDDRQPEPVPFFFMPAMLCAKYNVCSNGYPLMVKNKYTIFFR
ncbi:ComC/BlpC family leader-containing pheromone/bacteriocin [Aquimarina sp. EL_43]|uniref:bacteriocin-like protein n=1 Tax=Aquimarina sp. EL_43 TaxID=2787736 RepID=UPI0020C36518|nr:ComC/BlpC family leader-containing pheromone/bacteriocin [Aquimarina sp. EL_43]